MMDHLSSKLCAAAGFKFIPIHTGTVTTASIFEKRRMIALSHEQVDNAKSWSVFQPIWKFPLHEPMKT